MGLGGLVKPALNAAKKVGEFAIKHPDVVAGGVKKAGDMIKPAKKESVITEQDFVEIQTKLKNIQSENENLRSLVSDITAKASDLEATVSKFRKATYIFIAISIISIVISIATILF